MIPLIVIRPEPGCTATTQAAGDLGLTAHGFPLFAVSARVWEAPPPAQFDALLIGSANVFRHGCDALAAYRGLPVHAVGATTAAAARAAGFSVAATGAGGLQPILDAIPAGTRLLRLAGAERISLSPPSGVTMIERVVYESQPVPMPPELAAMLAYPAVVALHSAEAGRHFLSECERMGVDRSLLSLATIGPRVTAAAGPGWHTVLTADEASEAALLANAYDLCHTPATD